MSSVGISIPSEKGPLVTSWESGVRLIVTAITPDSTKGDVWHLLETRPSGQVMSYKVRLEAAEEVRRAGGPWGQSELRETSQDRRREIHEGFEPGTAIRL